MSDFFKKLKDVFLVEDPNAPQTTSSPSAKGTSQSQPNTPSVSMPSNASYTPVSTARGGQVNDKFLEILSKALEAANQEGFDYFEFKQALANLKNVPMDDTTRYKSAFAMSQAMGVTSKKLIDSGMYYLDVLKNEQTKFLQAADNQRQATVGNKQAQAQNLEAVMQQKAAQIKQLTAEIEQHRKEVDTIKTDISQSVVKVEQTTNDFQSTYAVLVGQIQADVTNMKNFLP